MALPDLQCRIAYATRPFDIPPTWTTLADSKLLGFVSERGRSSELEDFQTGTCTITLDNRDRAFDPANTSGAQWGNLRPRTRVDLKAISGGTEYDVFSGFTTRWPQTWDGLMGTVELPLTDAFGILQNETFATALIPDPNPENVGQYINDIRPAELTSSRIGWILDQAGFPAANRVISPGVVQVPDYGYAPTNSLGHMRDIAKAESGWQDGGGFLFMDAANDAIFQDKYYRHRNYSTSTGTFSDAPTGAELPYVAADIDDPQSMEHLVNHATGRRSTATDATAFEANDTASRLLFGPAAATLELFTSSNTEVEARTGFIVSRYSPPIERIKSITINPDMNTSLWAHALGRVIGERITVKNNYYGKGSVQTVECRIEGIRHEYTAAPLKWTTMFRLSPFFASENAGLYWLLGTSTLGVNTIPVW